MEDNFQQPVQPNSAPQPIIQQSVNPQQSANKISARSKLKWILLIAIFLVIAFGGGKYYLEVKQNKQIIPTPTIARSTSTPTPNPTANWKTYISPVYNPFYTEQLLQEEINRVGADNSSVKKIQFSIMYPPDWQQGIFDNSNPNEFDGGFTDSSGFKFYKGDFEIRIGKYYAPGGNSCDLFTKYETFTSFEPLQRVGIAKDEQTKQGFARFYICSKEKGNSIYGSVTSIGQISYLAPDTFKSPDIALMNSIVRTIKKIDSQNQDVDTANWKTYTNTKYNFSFKYPSTEMRLSEHEDQNRVLLAFLDAMGYSFEVKWIETSDPIDVWWAKVSKNYIPFIMSQAQFKGKAAGYFKNSVLAQVPMDFYAVQLGNYILTISFEVPDNMDFYSNPSDKQEMKKANEEFIKTDKIIIDQIISTFKFTN